MKSTFYYQQGYGGIEMFLAAVAVGAVIYFFFFPNKFHPMNSDTRSVECYKQPPDSTKTLTDDGVVYELLKEHAAITTRQYTLHTNTSAKVEIEGKLRDVSKAIIDSKGVVSHSGWKTNDTDFSALDLRFVDVGDNVGGRTPGISYINVYIKQGAPTPAFITDFCSKQPFIDDIAIFPDDQERSFPPHSIDLASITDWHCESSHSICSDAMNEVPKTGTYFLYAYDTPGSFAADFIARSNYFPYGTISLTVNGQTESYRTVFGAWEEKYIGVYGPNPQDSTKTVIYRYLRPAYLTLVSNPYLQANPDKIATSSLQLDEFAPFTIPAAGWWTPVCKPAVYLYPEKDTVVNVQVVIPHGSLSYTDPVYPNSGWSVLAKPSGVLHSLSKSISDSTGIINYPLGIFPYLYYEAKVQDTAVIKPQEGFVKSSAELHSFFDDLLPRLGLNEKESREFKEYWLKALPKTSYYFIGILPQEQLEVHEPLTITPQQDTMIRVRLYFEALDHPVSVQEPGIITPTRNGFTVVDWGGMVKTDKEHPFTCLQ